MFGYSQCLSYLPIEVQKIYLVSHRLTIRPGLAGTAPVLRPCPGVPAGWSKCPFFLVFFFLKITR